MAGTEKSGSTSGSSQRGGSSGGSSSGRGPSAADLTHALKGMDFPASKQELQQQAQQNNAPDEIINAIEQMQDEEFQTMADVARAFGEADTSQMSGSQHREATQEARKGGEQSRGGGGGSGMGREQR